MNIQSGSQAVEPKDIKVQILLAGGHQQTIYLKSDSPILNSLVSIIVARAAQPESITHCLFQIPINEGHGALCFSSDQLVGLITEPPVWVQQINPPIQSVNTYQPVDRTIFESNYIQIDNFLSEKDHKELIKYVLTRKSAFSPTNTSTNDINYRRSMVLYEFPEFSKLLINKIEKIIPDILSKLNLPSFKIAAIESQLTAHNDGNYYKIHNDNGSQDTATRELTFVYYFYREPKKFSGGELLIYDSKVENNFYVGAESFKTVEPRNNSIVFFLSRYMHEVLPVKCQSKSFSDSRFTINGWVRRGQ